MKTLFLIPLLVVVLLWCRFSTINAMCPTSRTAKRDSTESNDVFGPISNGQRATPEPTQDYGYNIASHAEREAP